jgi:hypothetical protein
LTVVLDRLNVIIDGLNVISSGSVVMKTMEDRCKSMFSRGPSTPGPEAGSEQSTDHSQRSTFTMAIAYCTTIRPLKKKSW